MTRNTAAIADSPGRFGLDHDLVEKFGLVGLFPPNHDRLQLFDVLPLSRRWKRNPERGTRAAGRSEWIFDADLEVKRRG